MDKQLLSDILGLLCYIWHWVNSICAGYNSRPKTYKGILKWNAQPAVKKLELHEAMITWVAPPPQDKDSHTELKTPRDGSKHQKKMDYKHYEVAFRNPFLPYILVNIVEG